MFQEVRSVDDQYFGSVVETAVAAQFGIGEDMGQLRYANWRVGKQ
jgi:hypothetical protein